MFLRTVLVSLGLLVAVRSAVADNPEMIYGKSSNEPVALIGLEEVMGRGDGCESHVGFFTVDSIAYDGVSDSVGGIRVRPTSGPIRRPNSPDLPFLITIETHNLPQVDKSWISRLVRPGTKLLIAFNTCGSGGYRSARDIYKADSLDW